MNSSKLYNVFDSHVHWLGTGEVHSVLNLKSLRHQGDVKNLTITSSCQKGDWVLGFGWDHNLWDGVEFPTRQILDECFPNHFVAFSRVDGHAVWVNTKVLKKMNLLEKPYPKDPMGGKFILDEEGYPTGVLIDTAMEGVWPLIPKNTLSETKDRLIQGMNIFNSNGITHIRDMSCDSEKEWEAKVLLDNSMSLFVDQWISTEDPLKIENTIQRAREAQKMKLQNIQVKGIKIYFDGALGSEGALLSQPYKSQPENYGLQLMTESHLESVLKKVWSLGMELAIHSIGDESTDKISRVVENLWNENYRGVIHIEHAQLVRPESIQRLKGKNVIFHMQPSHWLSDRKWLNEKLGDLSKYAFPWSEIERSDFKLFFGSDSPIENCSLSQTELAILDSQSKGITPPHKGWPFYHQYYDPSVTPDTFTVFESGQVKEVCYRGNPVI